MSNTSSCFVVTNYFPLTGLSFEAAGSKKKKKNLDYSE
jgi:hypothetical protein